MCAIEDHLRDLDVPLRGLIEAGRDDFADTPRDCLAHFLGTLVDEKNEQRRVGIGPHILDPAKLTGID